MKKNSLYHYTTLEGFHCMVNNNTPNKLRFHATHIRYLNDMSEYVYYQNLLWESFKKQQINIDKVAFNNFVSSFEMFSDPFVISFTEIFLISIYVPLYTFTVQNYIYIINFFLLTLINKLNII